MGRRRSVVVRARPHAPPGEAGGLTGVELAMESGNLTGVADAAAQPEWNLPAVINIAQGSYVGIRQYALNANGLTLNVTGLGLGLSYNPSLERIEATADATFNGTATFIIDPAGANVSATTTVTANSFVIHDITGLRLNSAGWTDFEALTATGYESARVVFVSNTGNDGTASIYGINDVAFDGNGMFQPVAAVNAYATTAAANAQMREGFPDIMLLNRGDEWAEGWTQRSGASESARAIVASYGAGNRPNLFSSFIGASGKSFFILSGLRAYDTWNDAIVDGNGYVQVKRAFGFGGASQHWFLEDCVMEECNYITITGNNSDYPTFSMHHVGFRRCIFTHNASYDGLMFASTINYFMLEENLFNEPWNERWITAGRTAKDIPYARQMYLSPGWSSSSSTKDSLQNVVLRKNIFSRAERDGINARGGGAIENNLFLQHDILLLGGVGGSENSIQSGSIVNNVFMQGTPNIGADNIIQITHIDGLTVDGNIWTDNRLKTKTSVQALLATRLEATLPEYLVLANVTVNNNIAYNFANNVGSGRFFDLLSGYETIENISITDNDFQYGFGSNEIIRHRDWTGGLGDRFAPFTYSGNRYYSTNTSNPFSPGGTYANWLIESGETGSSWTQVTYPDPSRTIDSYMTSIGDTGGADEFLAAATAQSRANWNPAYTAPVVNNYIRAGFGKTAI